MQCMLSDVMSNDCNSSDLLAGSSLSHLAILRKSSRTNSFGRVMSLVRHTDLLPFQIA